MEMLKSGRDVASGGNVDIIRTRVLTPLGAGEIYSGTKVRDGKDDTNLEFLQMRQLDKEPVKITKQ